MQNKVYLIAQPNSGKTTLFNLLAHENCYVANWPGKTVEVFHAKIMHHGREILLVDLPGINSFKALGKEESLTKEFLLENDDGVAVVLVNGESLYRSLYFAVQVLEMKNRAVLAINKSDYLERRGVHVNLEILRDMLGVEVVQISAIHGTGINRLMDRILDVLEGRVKGKGLKIDYGVLEPYIAEVEKILESRSLAIKAIEGEEKVIAKLPEGKRAAVEEIKKEIEKNFGNPEEIIAMYRHRFVESILSSAVREVKVSGETTQERLDRIFFGKFGGILSLSILFGILFLAFTINTGFPMNVIARFFGHEALAETIENYSLSGLISLLFETISELLNHTLPDSLLKSLIIEGIIAGVGAVATFFPLIVVLNFMMSLVEDSGIMARIATSMDRFFSLFGLTGKSVFPFSVSLACNVPGVMASRSLETDGERLRVALASPFVICQARLLVIVLFAVFLLTSPVLQSGIVILIYLLSSLLFLTATKFFGRIVKEESSEILLELPPYHFPSLRVVWWITWERSKSFITKIAGLLLAFSIFAWLMEYLGLTSVIGAILAKIFSPFGIEDPRLGFAILMGFFAKELIISSLAVSFGTADLAEISAQLGLSAPQALALIVFVAFYTPCVATISTMHAEVRNFRHLALSIAFQLIVAWTLAFIIFLLFNLL